jgi:hypothetical protein
MVARAGRVNATDLPDGSRSYFWFSDHKFVKTEYA